MTVVLALRCTEGLVLATDSQATSQLPGNVPVKLHATKIDRLGKHVLFGGTGSQGCGQRVKAALDPHASKMSPTKTKSETANLIHGLANEEQKKSMSSFVNYGAGAQAETWGGIFCGWSKDGPWIMEIDLNGSWQFADPFAATGSGYAFAHLALGTVQHYDVANQPLDAAKAIAYRAIETTCLVSAFGVGLPVQMGVVLEDGARLLNSTEIDELKESVNLWKAQEKETLGALAPTAEGESSADEDAGEGLEKP